MKHRNLLQIWFMLVVTVIVFIAVIRASQGGDIADILAVLAAFTGLATFIWNRRR